MLFRRVRAEFSDGVIDLLPLRLYPPEKEMGFGRVYDYMIVPHGTHREVGRISLRMGESPCVYYFGHIGYHVDPPYRGNHYARRACALLRPLIALHGKSSVVITTDPDNSRIVSAYHMSCFQLAGLHAGKNRGCAAGNPRPLGNQRRQVPIHLANRRLKRRCVLWK